MTEISHHKKSTIDAAISFLSEGEWRQELGVLLRDIVDEDGNVKRLTDLKSDAGVAWQKVGTPDSAGLSLNCYSTQVHAVYPKIEQDTLVNMSVNDIINYDASTLSLLSSENCPYSLSL